MTPGSADRGCERLQVQQAVAATAGEIFAVRTDPPGDVAIDSSGMLTEASGNIVTRAADTIVVRMAREALKRLSPRAVRRHRGDRHVRTGPADCLDRARPAGPRPRVRLPLEPVEEGALVTSYHDWSATEQAWKDAAIFPVTPESALRATLGVLARTVAPAKPRPASSTR